MIPDEILPCARIDSRSAFEDLLFFLLSFLFLFLRNRWWLALQNKNQCGRLQLAWLFSQKAFLLQEVDTADTQVIFFDLNYLINHLLSTGEIENRH